MPLSTSVFVCYVAILGTFCIHSGFFAFPKLLDVLLQCAAVAVFFIIVSCVEAKCCIIKFEGEKSKSGHVKADLYESVIKRCTEEEGSDRFLTEVHVVKMEEFENIF